ncbi:Hsp70 family protein [Lachnospiraceae bacterium OttesenSCG-928-E19]|nr:Hsp70 family protein [Lachnospiraceae bacterium OttesenSCG-928-E19]
MKNSIGIDFGTTNTTASITINGDEPKLVKLEQDNVTIPTALYFPDGGNLVYFGREAQKRYISHETDGRFMRSMKRILGTSLMDGRGTKIQGVLTKFDKIIELFITHIKSRAENEAGINIENVVMGRPVHFRDNDPTGDIAAENQLRQIALNAGFKNIEFQFEPIAAAFAHERSITSEKLAAVIDIGGGTSDFTIIRLSPERRDKIDRSSDILANTGVRIGGNDFDKGLSLQSFMPEFGYGSGLRIGANNDQVLAMPNTPYIDLSTWSSVNDLYSYKTLNNIKTWLMQSVAPEKLNRLHEIIIKELGHDNLDLVEQAKIYLSDKSNIEIKLKYISDMPQLSISRSDLEEAIHKDIEKINASLDECVRISGVNANDIDLVILTGGSTEIPYVTNTLQKRFPNAELSTSNKLASVGLGLAYDAMRRF